MYCVLIEYTKCIHMTTSHKMGERWLPRLYIKHGAGKCYLEVAPELLKNIL